MLLGEEEIVKYIFEDIRNDSNWIFQNLRCIFELILLDGELVEIRVRDKSGEEPLSSKDKKTAEDFIRKYYPNIINKWIKFFVLKQAIKSTTIKTKI